MAKIPKDLVINSIMKQIQFDVKKEFNVEISIDEIEDIASSQFGLVNSIMKEKSNKEETGIHCIGFGRFEIKKGRIETTMKRVKLYKEGKSKEEASQILKEEYYDMNGYKR